jgi:hypothetical protein
MVSSLTPSFGLSFIKTASSKVSEDDRLQITPRFGGDFLWSFKDAKLKYTQEVVLSIKEAVETRLEALIDLLAADDDPIDSVQIEVPGFPVVLYNIENLKSVKKAILRAWRLTAANWPQNDIPIRTVPVRRRQPVRQERRYSIESDSSTSCDSMPPLEPQYSEVRTNNGYNRHWTFDEY